MMAPYWLEWLELLLRWLHLLVGVAWIGGVLALRFGRSQPDQ